MSNMKNMSMQNKIISWGKRFLATTAVLVSTLGPGNVMANKQCNEKTAYALRAYQAPQLAHSVANAVMRYQSELGGKKIKVSVVACTDGKTSVSVRGAGKLGREVQNAVKKQLRNLHYLPNQNVKFSITLQIRGEPTSTATSTETQTQASKPVSDSKACGKTARLTRPDQIPQYARAVADAVMRYEPELGGKTVKVRVVACTDGRTCISVRGAGKLGREVQNSVKKQLRMSPPVSQDFKFGMTLQVRE